MILYTFGAVPDFARGQVRDLRVRWALEEVGLSYQVRPVGKPPMMPMSEYRAIQPFGQVPAIEDDGIVVFETGAILLHIAEKAGALLPREPAERATALQWLFAALSTIEPVVRRWAEPPFFHPGEAWLEQAQPLAEAALTRRLGQLAAALGGRHWIAGAFSIADILMATVLRPLDGSGLLEAEPALAAYRARCEDRPAFARALAAHLADLDRGKAST